MREKKLEIQLPKRTPRILTANLLIFMSLELGMFSQKTEQRRKTREKV